MVAPVSSFTVLILVGHERTGIMIFRQWWILSHTQTDIQYLYFVKMYSVHLHCTRGQVKANSSVSHCLMLVVTYCLYYRSKLNSAFKINFFNLE